MKHLILAWALLGASLQFVPQYADAQNSYLGYTTMKFSRNNSLSFNSASTRNGMAVHFSAAKMASLKGAKIVGVRTAVATSRLSAFKVFATQNLNSTPLAEKNVAFTSKDKLYQANDYLFDSPVTIDGSDLYVGYEVTTQTAGYRVSYFDGAKDFTDGTAWVIQNDQWTDVSRQGYGAPIVQLIVEGMPQTYQDVVLRDSKLGEYLQLDGEYSMTNELFNMGVQPVTSVKVRTELEGAEPLEEEITGLNIPAGAEGTFVSHNLHPNELGHKSLKVSVVAVNGKSDSDASDNTLAQDCYVYPQGVKRNMVIEKHTGQGCTNCPAGDVQIASFTKDRDDMIVVAHHTYIQATIGDLFTMEESEAYRSFFGFSLYPSISLNRQPVSESSIIMNDISGTTNSLRAMVGEVEKLSIPVTVDLENHFDASTRKGELKVKVHTFENPSASTHTLNLWLTQDNMVASQTGAGTQYHHSHTFRGTLNGETWGEPITLTDGEDLLKTYEYEIPDSTVTSYGTYKGTKWEAVPEEMHIVAFVGDKTDNPLNCPIYNAATIGVTTNGSTTAIAESTTAVQAQPVVESGSLRVVGNYKQAQVYSLDGKLVAQLYGFGSVRLAKGIYVVRIDGRSAKVAVK